MSPESTAAAGFPRVRISPELGSLTSLDAAVTHPRGMIKAQYSLREGKLSAVITLREGLNGVFDWRGQRRALVAGRMNSR
jgi:hypothetical protein